MRPSVGSLLEVCWAEDATSSNVSLDVRGGLVMLPDGEDIPARVREITGLRPSDLAEGARSLEERRADFAAAVSAASRFGERPAALIHYAQFEEAWLKELLGVEDLPFDVFCTHRIASRLFPKAPSRNIRGLTGFFGHRIGEIKRAAQHVRATHLIWQGLVPALATEGVSTLDDLRVFMTEKKKKPTARRETGGGSSYDYRVDRAKRLALPEKPGLYKMIAKSGEILYVGKATCLKDRVNSYFRGKKGRDPRKLEMMAQVWDLEVIECESAIEAALIESDEIKKLNPPYNVSLKTGHRSLVYYDRSLTQESPIPTRETPIGPFRKTNAIDHLRLFVEGLKSGIVPNVFYQPIAPEILKEGQALFKDKHGPFAPTVRTHIAFGLRFLRSMDTECVADDTSAIETFETETETETETGTGTGTGTETGTETEAATATATETETPSTILKKIEHLHLRAASTYLRSKALTRLLWSDIRWSERGETKSLHVRGGRLATDPALRSGETVGLPWHGLTLSDYDRMSVLLMEISKVDHEIEAVR